MQFGQLDSRVNTSLLDHQFSKADRLWLDYAVAAQPFDRRIARAKLHQQLPRNFNPDRIDRRFYRDNAVTLMGLRLFKPDHELLKNVEKVALAVQNEILKSPGVDELTLDQIKEITGLDGLQTIAAIHALGELSPFFTGMSDATHSGRPRTYFINGNYGYDAPLAFTTLDDALMKAYRIEATSLRYPVALPEPTEPSGSKRAPSAKQRSDTISLKKRTAFVIMAMDQARPELVDVLEAIREVCASFGIKAHRADEIQHQDKITDVILAEIRSCEFLIADLSFERPNVYYEVGFAHALDKKPILYRRSGTALHFDLAVHNVPEYKNITELRELLRLRFEAILGRTAA